MRSWLFPAAASAAAAHGEDEEEGAALVQPPPTPGEKEDGIVVIDGGGGADEQRQPPAAANRAPWWWSWSGGGGRWRWPPGSGTKGVGLVAGGLVFLAGLFLLAGAACRSSGSCRWINVDSSSFLLGRDGISISDHHGRRPPHHSPSSPADLVPIPFTCGNASSSSGKCRRRVAAASPPPSSAAPPSSSSAPRRAPPPRCPDYFRYIHSDLAPWRETGITREAVERGRDRAAFRLVVAGGRAYVETYHRVFQTRDTFTQWGIAQLLARYPGRVPDLDLMFNCEDMPEVRAADFPAPSAAPPLFRYCKDDATLDVVFPDWSFWGWPEINIRPWAPLLEEMAGECRRLPWPARAPYAEWKGNPGVSAARGDLLRCNVSGEADWNARVFAQDWDAAARAGFKNSNLARQCDYRYKIFVQGRSWSVSEKYILACDSPALLVATPFRDFFSRGLVAGRHYWPVEHSPEMCAAVKFAVDWGNAHPAQARRMASEGSGFAREEVSMDYVYDYMLHLLTEYAKLLRYKPTVPENAVELCPEAVACPARGRERQFMMESRERFVADYEPCALPPPFTAGELREMARREEEVRRRVHRMMEEQS
ncbi:hypothetical protein ACP4OV_005677 [Aristida adscensionis]